MTIGQRIKELRGIRNLTQREFAQLFYVNNSTLAMWETDKNEPDIATIKKLAQFFDVSTDYLLGVADEWGNVTDMQKVSPDLNDDERNVLHLYNALSRERRREAIVWLKTLNELDDKTKK